MLFEFWHNLDPIIGSFGEAYLVTYEHAYHPVLVFHECNESGSTRPIFFGSCLPTILLSNVIQHVDDAQVLTSTILPLQASLVESYNVLSSGGLL